jgi:ribosome maturation factor RimP
MRIQQRLEGLVVESVRALGYELVGVACFPRGRGALVRVYIDSPQGISLEDCERVSRQISGVLDVADPIAGPYTLEVSSPGVDRPLFTAEQFERYAGERVRLRLESLLDGRRNISGVLRGCQDGKVLVDDAGRTFQVPLEAIARAHLDPELEFQKR